MKKANKLPAISHNRIFTVLERLHLQFLSQDEVVISSLFGNDAFFLKFSLFSTHFSGQATLIWKKARYHRPKIIIPLRNKDTRGLGF